MPQNAIVTGLQVSSDELRAVQHRVRNDLQTLSALWRLAYRRAEPEEMVSLFPEWLDALTAVYDSVPLSAHNDTVLVRDLLTAIKTRFALSAFDVSDESAVTLSAQMAVVGVLALSGMLGWCSQSIAAGHIIHLRLAGDTVQARVEARFKRGLRTVPWPPLALEIATSAAATEYIREYQDDEVLVVMVIRCR